MVGDTQREVLKRHAAYVRTKQEHSYPGFATSSPKLCEEWLSGLRRPIGVSRKCYSDFLNGQDCRLVSHSLITGRD